MPAVRKNAARSANPHVDRVGMSRFVSIATALSSSVTSFVPKSMTPVPFATATTSENPVARTVTGISAEISPESHRIAPPPWPSWKLEGLTTSIPNA